jgi:hypothetical protein
MRTEKNTRVLPTLYAIEIPVKTRLNSVALSWDSFHRMYGINRGV